MTVYFSNKELDSVVLYFQPVIVLLWLVSFGSIVTVSCVSYDQFRENGVRWSPAGLAAFDTVSRSVWGLAVGWIVVASQWGYAGKVKLHFTNINGYVANRLKHKLLKK